MKRLVTVFLTIILCLCGCSKSESYQEERIETYLRQILPDQKPLHYLEVENDTASEFLLHIAVYHGLVHGYSTAMTTDEIMRNVNACFTTVGELIVDFEYAPAEYDEASETWIPYPHNPEYNLFYVVHNVETSERYLEVQVSSIGFDENGLYTFSPDGEIQYEDDLRYKTYEDMDSLKKKILSEPEKFEIISITLQEEQGELTLMGS